MVDAARRAQAIAGVLGCFVVACGGAPAAPPGGAAGGGGNAAAAGVGGATATGGGGGTATAGGAAGDTAAAGASGGSGPTTDAAAGASGGSGAPANANADASKADAATTPDAAAGPALPKNVLIFTRSTNAYVHESKPIAAANIKAALAPLGVTGTLSEDATVFSAAGLAPFGAIILVDTSGKPFGDPGTAQLTALQAFVRAGGGLVAIHATNASTYDVASPYVRQLLGATYVSHPGDVRMTTCFTTGAHPSVAQLPASFPIVDEIFTYTNLRVDSVVVVECLATDGKTRLPIAWHHVEGAGRVFNTALGHPIDLWTPGGLLLDKHVVPGVLWTLGL